MIMSIEIAVLCSIGGALMTGIILLIIIHFVNKYRFNKGICRKCGGKLRCFDVDSGGGEGYCCIICNHTIWI